MFISRKQPSYFQQVLNAAIADITEHGFDRQSRIDHWVEEIRKAALEQMVPEAQLDKALRDSLGVIYKRMVEREGIFQRHAGVERFTLHKVKPKLREELDRRIMASANLIRINRAETIQKTLRRFSGWATSIPAGGSDVVDKQDTKVEIRKALSSLPYEERRVLIDQGHKLNSALSEILAQDGNAIAAMWRSHWQQAGYGYRPEHKARDKVVYAVRGNWALQQGLMKPGFAGYTDEIERPAEFVYCRCYYRYLYSLRDLPDEMLTVKGKHALAQAKAA